MATTTAATLKTRSVRLTDAQWAKMQSLGSSTWLQGVLDDQGLAVPVLIFNGKPLTARDLMTLLAEIQARGIGGK